MKAVLCKELGLPENLVVEEVPSPKAAQGQVVVSVKACGVNFPDTLIIQGKYQFKPELPFSPGGGADIMGRLFAKRFTESLGQTFVAENRAGAGGLIGAEIVARSAPDGYNILVTTASLSVNVSLHKKLAFDPVRDLAPVSQLTSVPLLLAVHPSVPARSEERRVGKECRPLCRSRWSPYH